MSEIVRFTHYTVQEFLQDKYLHKVLTPIDLAKVCLTYLTFDIFEDRPCADSDAFYRRMKSYQFSVYAMQY